MPDTLTTIETVPMPIGPFFRFPDKETCMKALEVAGLLNEEGEPITASHHHSLDIVGTITRGGSYDPETGEVLEPPTTLPGWHVNYLGEVPDGWEEFAVHPVNPTRVYAAAVPAPVPTTPPPAERIGQEWTDPAGNLWRVVQATDPASGQFAADDPDTPERESLKWVKA